MATTGIQYVVRFMLAVATVLISTFVVKLYHARSFVRQLQKKGYVRMTRVVSETTLALTHAKPMPPHHWLFGHVALSASILGGLPPYAHGVYIGDQIRQRYPHLDEAFYLDTWPFGPIMLVVMSPNTMYQLTQANQIPKDKGLRHFLKPLTGKEDLVTLEGAAWKRWRGIFNPGFSANHISTLIPSMVEEVEAFKSILEKHAETGELLYLEEASLNLTIDIIGRAVM